jgi:hypothetical protein
MISDSRVAALTLLSKQIENECREALRQAGQDDERRQLETAVRNIISARKTLERVSAGRLLRAAGRTTPA